MSVGSPTAGTWSSSQWRPDNEFETDTMVPGRLLPLAPTELLHQRDRPIPRGRPRAVARDVRRPGRWDDDRRTPRPRRFVDGDRVIGGVSGDAHEWALDRGEQIEAGGRIITRLLGQRVDKDHAGLIDAKVELPPATPAAATVFRGGPLTCPDDGQTRAVEHEMDALAGRDRPQTAPQILTAPGERRIVRGGEVEAHHPEQGVQESFGLAQREMVEESQSQGGLDGEIRVAPLPTPPAAPVGASRQRSLPRITTPSHRRVERGPDCRPPSSQRGTSSYTWDGPSTSSL